MNDAIKYRTTQILALIGAAALVILIFGFGVRLLKEPLKSFASLFSAISLSRERIAVDASPSTVFAGEKFLVSWEHEGKTENGIYDFSYPCQTGLSLSLESKEIIPCNSAFSVTGKTNISLLAEITGEASIDLPLSIAFTPEGSDRPSISGSKTITIIPRGANTGTTTTPSTGTGGNTGGGKTTPSPVFGPGTSTNIPIPGGGGGTINPNGAPDLKIEIVGIGIISTTTGVEVFIPKTSVARGEKAAVMFDVTNIGDNVTGEWNFSAQLPVSGGNFSSGTQPSINPDPRGLNGVRYTLGFENLNNPGANTVTISLDPQAKLWRDPNRLNNVVSVTINRAY